MTSLDAVEATLALGKEVAETLRQLGVEPLLIGAMALAVHNHPRLTEDLDLAIAVPPRSLDDMASSLRGRGYDVVVRLPDPSDPLGGVVTVRAPPAYPVEIVNFDNAPGGGFPALVRDALTRATTPRPGLPFPVVDVTDLILFKLYSGGRKSEQDILELLVRNPVDINELRERCRHYRMERQLDDVLAKATSTER